jgi:hypothetical protein
MGYTDDAAAALNGAAGMLPTADLMRVSAVLDEVQGMIAGAGDSYNSSFNGRIREIKTRIEEIATVLAQVGDEMVQEAGRLQTPR